MPLYSSHAGRHAPVAQPAGSRHAGAGHSLCYGAGARQIASAMPVLATGLVETKTHW